jgi:glycosyltransferase involved in cell wall biosynthesis
MKILCFIDDLRSGGAQRQLMVLARDFKRDGHEVHVFFYVPHFYYAEFLKEHGIPYACIEAKSPFDRLFNIRRAIRNLKPDAIIAFMAAPSMIAEFAGFPFRNWKLIVGERSADPKILREPRSRFIRFTHLLADYIVSNSQSNIDIILKVNPLIPRKKIKIIYNSLDLQKFIPDPNFRFRADGKLRIIVPATYRKLKNILGLIEAVSLLDDTSKEKLQIDWFGEKNYDTHFDNVLRDAETLIEKYSLQNTIRLFDVERNIAEKMKQYDAVGLFSVYEGLPNVVCEGMACGKVIIASSVSDLPLFIHHGKNGFLCNPNDVNDIKRALVDILKTNENTMQQIAILNRKYAEENFDSDKVYSSYYNLIKN